MHGLFSKENPFLSIPVWTINDIQLAVSDNVKYLGSTLSTANSSVHIHGRIKAAQNAYYALQGGGLKFNTVSPKTALNVYNIALKSVLLFDCNAVHLNSGHISKLEKTQNKLIKCLLGIGYYTHITSILKATGITTVSDAIGNAAMGLLYSCVFSDSLTSQFYLYLLKENNFKKNSRTLIGRVQSYMPTNAPHQLL